VPILSEGGRLKGFRLKAEAIDVLKFTALYKYL
jgi:hypothetical protein